jgi:hypothetical protein
VCHGLRFAAFGRLPMSPPWKERLGGAFFQNETGDCLAVDKQRPREARDDDSVLIEPSGSHIHIRDVTRDFDTRSSRIRCVL